MLFLACVGIGLVAALIALLFGDAASHGLIHLEVPFLQPVTLIGGITVFGGSGLLLLRLTRLSPGLVSLTAAGLAVLSAVTGYFIWVKPMARAEQSVGYSIKELAGRIGEVITTIPPDGVGEILLPLVSGMSNQIAASLEQMPIPAGTRVVVVDVRDHVLYVVPFEEERRTR